MMNRFAIVSPGGISAAATPTPPGRGKAQIHSVNQATGKLEPINQVMDVYNPSAKSVLEGTVVILSNVDQVMVLSWVAD